mgnify:CR=1 FL=1
MAQDLICICHIDLQGLSGTVAKHYNDLKEGTVQDRFRSRIYYQRNFNNWIKVRFLFNSQYSR